MRRTLLVVVSMLAGLTASATRTGTANAVAAPASVIVITNVPEYSPNLDVVDGPSTVIKDFTVDPTSDPLVHEVRSAGAVVMTLRLAAPWSSPTSGFSVTLANGCQPNGLIDDSAFVAGRFTKLRFRTFGPCAGQGISSLNIQFLFNVDDAGALTFSQAGLDFGYVAEGALAIEELVIGNVGTVPVELYIPSRSAGDVIVDALPCTSAPLAPGSECLVTISVPPALERGSLFSVVVIQWDRSSQYLFTNGQSGPELIGGLTHRMVPTRMLDTRTGVGGLGARPLGSEARSLQITGRSGIPEDAQGIIANVTVTEPTAWSFLTLWPHMYDKPDVSNINFEAGDTVANQSVIALGDDGAISIANEFGSVQVLIDVVGWIGPDGELTGERVELFNRPARLVDTRRSQRPLGPGEARSFRIDIQGTQRMTAIVANITAVSPTAPSTFLTGYPTGVERPDASIVNTIAGVDRPNLVVLPVSADHSVTIYNAFGTTHVLIDVVGYFEPQNPRLVLPGRIVPIRPSRYVDTRPTDELPGWTIWRIEFPGRFFGRQVQGWITNVTVDQPHATGFMNASQAQLEQSDSSSLNFRAGQTVANQAWLAGLDTVTTAPLEMDFANWSSDWLHLLADLQAVVI